MNTWAAMASLRAQMCAVIRRLARATTPSLRRDLRGRVWV